LRIDACAALARGKAARPADPARPIENWRAEEGLFLLSRRADPAAEPARLRGATLFE